MKRHSLYVLSLCLGLFLLTGCGHGGDEETVGPDDPIPTDLPFSGTAAFGAVADPLKGLTIEFGIPMDPASVEDNLLLAQGSASASESVADAAVNLSASDLTFHWNAAKDTVTIFAPLPYCEDYVLTLGANTANAAGAVRGEAQVIEFSTRVNPGDFDGLDCMADLGFYNDAGLVVLGEEIMTFLGSEEWVSIMDLTLDGKHWVYEKLPFFQRLDNVTAEGHAMFAGGTGEPPVVEAIFWKGYAQTLNPPYTGSIPFNLEEVVQPGGVRSIPDLNADGLNEIGIYQDYMFDIDFYSMSVMRDRIIFGGAPLRLASDLAEIENADVRHYQYSKAGRFEVGDLDGDGAMDLVYFFMDRLGDELGCRYFIVFSPEISGALTYLVADVPEVNYQFNADHETIVSSKAQTPSDPVLWDGAVGDFNGDGIDDIAALAAERDLATPLTVGNLYFLFGVEGMRSNRTMTTAPVSKVISRIPTPDSSVSLIARDLNADGYADLVVSARGLVQIYLGREAWDPEYASGEFKVVSFSADGNDFMSLLGAVFAGDVNNDGYQDLRIGAEDISGSVAHLLFLGRDYLPGARLTSDQADVIFSK